MTDNDIYVYLWTQVTERNWKYVAVLLIIGLVSAIRKVGGRFKPLAWTRTDFGGFFLATVTGMGGAVLHSLVAGQPLTLALTFGVGMSLMAVGGYVGSKQTFRAAKRRLKKGKPS